MTKMQIDVIDWLHRERPTSEGGGPYKYREIAKATGYTIASVCRIAANYLSEEEQIARWKAKRAAKRVREADPKIPSPFGGVRQSVVDWLERRKPDGTTYNFTEIGAECGVTRERVRQIAAKLGIRGFPRNSVAATERARQAKFQRGIHWKQFIHLVRSWLSEIGVGYCATCHAAKGLSEMCLPRRQRCKECVAAQTRRWYQANPEKVKAWQRNNPEKCRENWRRYYQRLREARRTLAQGGGEATR